MLNKIIEPYKNVADTNKSIIAKIGYPRGILKHQKEIIDKTRCETKKFSKLT